MSYIDILIFIFVFAPNILGMFCCVSAYFSLAYSEGKYLRGFTFCNTGYWGKASEKISWLGWDYAHSGDFMGNYSTDNPFYYLSKQWTTAEIYEEVKGVIEQIIEVEKYVNSDEAKFIQTMLEDCREAYYDYLQAKEICRILYEKGYRKQSDTARGFVKRLKELLHKYEHRSQTDGVSFYQMNAESFCDEINEIAEQYGVEVEE